MVVALAAIAVGAIVGSAVVGGFQAKELNKANKQITANNIEIIKFQTKQKRVAINEARGMIAGQIRTSAASSGVSVGSVSVGKALEFNATQRGRELGNLIIEQEALASGLTQEGQVSQLQVTSQARGQILSSAGAAAGASQGFFR